MTGQRFVLNLMGCAWDWEPPNRKDGLFGWNHTFVITYKYVPLFPFMLQVSERECAY